MFSRGRWFVIFESSEAEWIALPKSDIYMQSQQCANLPIASSLKYAKMAELDAQQQEHQQHKPRRLSVAAEGSMVLLEVNDGDKFLFAHLNSSATLKIKNMKCSLAPIIGSPYGSLFQVESGPKGPYLKRMEIVPKGRDLLGSPHEKDIDEARDNRYLVDNNTAQKLSAEEIHLMRSKGKSGDEIVEAIIANCSTFNDKTTFSQEKYKKKKQKKYLPQVLLRRPSAHSICEAYFNKAPRKTGFLRMDALSLILSLANIGPHSNVLVFDMVGGLILGAVAERMAGFGSVCNVHANVRPPPMDITGLFNFDHSTLSKIYRIPLSELLSGHTKHLQCSGQNGDGDAKESSSSQCSQTSDTASLDKGMKEFPPQQDTTCSNTLSENIILECTSSSQCKGTHDENDMEIDKTSEVDHHDGSEKHSMDNINSCLTPKVQKMFKGVRQARIDNILSWTENGFSSLIIAAQQYDPWTILAELLPLLTPSGSFVIYHQYIQPLAECMHRLQKKRMAVALQICEPWLREYQVLPSRTHPHMQMSSTGGYILSGIRINNIQ